MKIILKNEADGELILYTPPSTHNTRYGDLLTFVRQHLGHFQFRLSAIQLPSQQAFVLNNQNDLDTLLDAQRANKYLEIKINSPPTLHEECPEPNFNFQPKHSLVSHSSQGVGETSKSSENSRSDVGKFRKMKASLTPS